MSKPKKKASRKRVDVKTKLEIAAELSRGVSQSSVINKYGISRRACTKIKSEDTELQKLCAKNAGIERAKSLKCGAFPQIEKALHDFVVAGRRAGLQITRNVLHVRALKLRNAELSSMNDKDSQALQNFSASERWVSNFVRRYGLKSIALHGQAGSVDHAAIKEGMKQLRRNLQSYELDCIYNMDETGLFYKLLPKRSYVFREDTRNVRGTKAMKAKDRITLIITTNASGSHILPPTVIGSSKKPRAFNLRKCPLPYLSQNKAWNDTLTCRKWFCRDFLPAVRQKTSKKVALIMDNASSHGNSLTDPLGQVTVLYLPPNCTSVQQPMDCGVIAALKTRYRFMFLDRTISLFEKRDSLRRLASRGLMEQNV